MVFNNFDVKIKRPWVQTYDLEGSGWTPGFRAPNF